MNKQALEQEARGMKDHELREALDWNEALADHCDENMDFSGYEKCKTKVDVIKDELRRRGK